MFELSKIFEEIKSKKVIVVGDVMVDEYISGRVSRISPEAPVPVIEFETREKRLGGAANVALNIKAMGADPIICSVIGKAEDGDEFLRLMNENKLSARGVLRYDDRITTVKTRILGNNQQLLRVDREKRQPISSYAEFSLIQEVKEIIERGGIDAVIFQDYNKGVLTENVIKGISEIASENDIIISVDPKNENFFTFEKVTLFKPNLKELSEAMGKDINCLDQESFQRTIDELRDRIGADHALITLSEHGLYMSENGSGHFIPAHLRIINDVSGAGDTVISVATLGLVCGLSPEMVGKMANLAGGLVCEKVGVVSIDREQLMSETRELLQK